MGEGAGNDTVLRFDVAVRGDSYRALVQGLRSPVPGSRLRPPPQRTIQAQIELNIHSRLYSLTTLGRHRLPKALRVEPGSRTHTSLTNYLRAHLSSETAKTVAQLLGNIIDASPVIEAETLKLFRDDLQLHTTTVRSEGLPNAHTVLVVDEISTEISLDIDDLPTLTFPSIEQSELLQLKRRLKDSLALVSPLTATIDGNSVTVQGALFIPGDLAQDTEIYLHWGSYDDSSPPWQDELVTIESASSGSSVRFEHDIHIPIRGVYGITLFGQIRGTAEPIWLGRPWLDDARVTIASDDLDLARARAEAFERLELSAVNSLREHLGDIRQLSSCCETLTLAAPHLALGSLLAQACSIGVAAEQAIPLARTHNDGEVSAKLTSALNNYAIGEVVFVAPEGPHAGAGGLAQVISGLCPELSLAGIPVSIISPLYAYDNGSKHPSAEQFLRHGVRLGSERVRPSLLATISVSLGPTYHRGTTTPRRHPATIPLKVYLAQHGSLRLFLLSNASVFDRLYQPVFCDEQLRRAIALSRGALELLVDPQFGIRPSILVSNDWMTATIPPLMALDPRYRDNTRLSTCKTIHMIHNGGADYHGRLPTHVNDEDLWPLLGLAPEHFFGFRDPFNSELLNVTTAAAHHASGAILTVSQRYAEELTTPGCGDGLGFILSEKKERVFGISNAILHSQVETFLCRLANLSDPTFGSLHDLVDGKLRVRSLLQEKFGLRSDPHAKLLSVVGRLAEQKGLKLLSGIVSTSGNSVLEEILVQNPEAQIIVAGPSTEGDREAHYLMDCLSYLTRRYPGRISAYLDYVPHAEALQIIFGSTFFLMPSRFEPGGITQLEALAAGTLVIGRRTGGIAATIENYCEQGCSGNGFLCDDFDPTAFFNTAQWAFKSIRSADTYRKLVANCTQARHNWSDRLPMYRALFQHILLGPSVCAEIPWVKESIAALDRCRVAS